MIVKTKKYQLDKKIFRKIGMRQVFKQQWWLPVSIFVGVIVLNLLINLFYSNIWIYTLAPIGVGLYWLVWYIQFVGIPQLPQNQTMFEKLYYEISSPQILIKKNEKEGMVIKWDMIQKAEKRADAFVLILSKAQFFYFPFKIFNSENDIRFVESILKRKELLPQAEQ